MTWKRKSGSLKICARFPNTLNDEVPFLQPGGNEEPMLNKYASFQAPFLKCAELTSSVRVGPLPAYKWMNDGFLQSPQTLRWCWHTSWRFSQSSTYTLNFSRLAATCKCSIPSANGRIMQNFILDSLFQQRYRFHFQFYYSHTKFYGVTFFNWNINFLVYAATQCLETSYQYISSSIFNNQYWCSYLFTIEKELILNSIYEEYWDSVYTRLLLKSIMKPSEKYPREL